MVEGGRARNAVRGELLVSGSTIATGPRGRAVIVRGEEFVVVSPRTQLRVPTQSGTSNRIIQLIEDFGTAIFKIRKQSTRHFGVQTPYLAAVVKGTTFTVTVGAEGSSVQVTEGAVQVVTLDGGAAEMVHPGAIAMVGASDLFRLTVEGQTSKTIRSPNSPAEIGAKAAPAAQSAAYSGPPAKGAEISKRLDEESRSLKEVTSGLIEGSVGVEVAQAEFREQARDAAKDRSSTGNGSGQGPARDDHQKPSGPGKPGDPPKPGEGKEKPGDDGKGKPGGDGKGKPGDDDKGRPSDDGKGKPGDDGKGKPGDDDKGRPGGEDPVKPGDDDKSGPGGEDRVKPGDDDKSGPGGEDRIKPADDKSGPAGEDRTTSGTSTEAGRVTNPGAR